MSKNKYKNKTKKNSSDEVEKLVKERRDLHLVCPDCSYDRDKIIKLLEEERVLLDFFNSKVSLLSVLVAITITVVLTVAIIRIGEASVVL